MIREDAPALSDHHGAAAERRRLAEADSGAQPWRAWGPYVAERAWGTVREDYSEYRTVWDYFSHRRR